MGISIDAHDDFEDQWEDEKKNVSATPKATAKFRKD